MNLNEILFWTEKDDPENSEASSKDPLGTETFAGELGDLILPGLTSLTRRIRYVTLICFWLRFIKEDIRKEGAQETLDYIKNFEKLNAYSIVKSYKNNQKQTDGLLGKTYAQACVDKGIDTFQIDRKHYPFLVNHGVTGAFGNYKVLLKALKFVEENDEFKLTPNGEDLAKELQVSDKEWLKNILKNSKVPSRSKQFMRFAEVSGLCNFKPSEKQRLKSALLAHSIRKTSFLLIKSNKSNKKESEFDTLSAIAKHKVNNDDEKKVTTIGDYITRFERLNREAHYIFYSLMGIDTHQIGIDDFVKNSNVSKSLKILTGNALDKYLVFHADNEQFLGKIDKRPYNLFIRLKGSRNDYAKCLSSIIEHHKNNQKQKGKAPWMDYKDGKCTIILHTYKKSQEEVDGMRDRTIHSYRTDNARRIIDELGI